ncbi:putative glycoside hydrolase [Aerococcaceae bacterium DSM 111020]|nr:putative glycoside hydrolase [Aerococcaceae bacterium DSM 111020]
MIIEKNYTKHFKHIALILSALFILSACQETNDENTENPTDVAEDITYKYDQEAVDEFHGRQATQDTARYENITLSQKSYLNEPENLPQSLYYDTGVDIPYPEDGVRGVYLTAQNVADPEYFESIVNYINSTDLNAVVIDFKDDWGHIIPPNESDNPLVQENTIEEVDYRAIMEVLEENQIYPIARITTFKDNLLSDQRPDLSFIDPETNEIWSDANGAQFLNPFMHETWDYVLDVAEEAAKMGFKDIQFDYVRFPEGFFEWAGDLEYEIGYYEKFVSNDPEAEGYERVAAINDFLAYSQQALAPYGVEISADIFGYTTVAGDTYDVRGIGQNFAQMAEQVDTVSAMIYPSHWGESFFGLTYPDLFPYEVVDNYMYAEKNILTEVENDVNTRPWLQDFTDSFLPPGTYQEYGPEEVQAQINALAAHGINEFLLWNAGGYYTEGVDYTPEIDQTLGFEEEFESSESQPE